MTPAAEAAAPIGGVRLASASAAAMVVAAAFGGCDAAWLEASLGGASRPLPLLRPHSSASPSGRSYRWRLERSSVRGGLAAAWPRQKSWLVSFCAAVSLAAPSALRRPLRFSGRRKSSSCQPAGTSLCPALRMSALRRRLGTWQRPAVARRTAAEEDHDQALQFATVPVCFVQFEDAGRPVSAYAGETPLDVGVRSGEVSERSSAPFCREGACYHCEATVLAGGSCLEPSIPDGECARLCKHRIIDSNDATSTLSVRLFAADDDFPDLDVLTAPGTTSEATGADGGDDVLFV